MAAKNVLPKVSTGAGETAQLRVWTAFAKGLSAPSSTHRQLPTSCNSRCRRANASVLLGRLHSHADKNVHTVFKSRLKVKTI